MKRLEICEVCSPQEKIINTQNQVGMSKGNDRMGDTNLKF